MKNLSRKENRGAEAVDEPGAFVLERALRDPSGVFACPDDVVDDARFTPEQKFEILRSWEYDAAEIAVAEEEGMRGPENGLLQSILLALARLGRAHDLEAVAPTKQHGIP